MKDNIILLGSDHLGLSLKNSLKNHLQDKGYKVDDVGVDNEDPVDYPDVGEKLASKIPGVRAVCINDPYTAERAIASNNAQVVTLGGLITGKEVGKKLVDIWLENDFQGGKSLPKVEKINKLDTK